MKENQQISSETKIGMESGENLGINLNRVNRDKAQNLLDTFFKPLEAKNKMVGTLISDSPRTIRFSRDGAEDMIGKVVDVNGAEFIESKIRRKITKIREENYKDVVETVKNIDGEDIEVI